MIIYKANTNNIKAGVVKRNVKIQTGDIIFTSKNSFISNVMGFFQDDIVQWGHVLIAKNSKMIYEPTSPLCIISIEECEQKRKHWKIIRYKYITEDNQFKIQKFLDKLVGEKYSFFRLFLQGIDHLFHTNYFTNRLKGPSKQVCSSMVAWAYYASMKIKFNDVSWRSCDPDDIEDHIEKYPDNWDIIMEV